MDSLSRLFYLNGEQAIYTEIETHNQKYKVQKDTYVKDAKIHQEKLTQYETLMEKMKNAKTSEQYDNYMKEFEKLEKHFQKSNCVGPLPPAPPIGASKPGIEQDCHRSYKLGWMLGKDVTLLMIETGESYSELLKQMKCVKEYESMEALNSGQAELKKLCFKNGTNAATKII